MRHTLQNERILLFCHERLATQSWIKMFKMLGELVRQQDIVDPFYKSTYLARVVQASHNLLQLLNNQS